MQKSWEDFYKSNDYFHLEPHEALPGLVSKCDQLNFSKVLDLGCGSGQDLLFLAEKGFEVTGVDFSPSAATNAEDLLQSKGLEGKIFVDNLFDRVSNFAPHEFEIVLAINSLEYTDQKTFESTIRQITSILADRGLFLLVVPSKKADIKDIEENRERLFFSEDEVSNIVNKNFHILDFVHDKNENLVLLLQKPEKV